MKTIITLGILFCVLSLVESFGYIQVIEAGTRGKRGPILFTNSRFCAKSFSAKGFSLQCIFPNHGTHTVEFGVDHSKVRKEKVSPYFINGDFENVVYPWVDAPSEETAIITCLSNTGEKVEAKVHFTCNNPGKSELDERPAEAEARAREIHPVQPTHHGMCFKIPASRYFHYVGAGWTAWKRWMGGLWFRKPQQRPENRKLAHEQLVFKFQPKVSSNYAVMLELEAVGSPKDEQLFLYMKEGMVLRKNLQANKAKGLIPVQPIPTKRRFQTHADPNWDMSISTVQLDAGKTYTIAVSARSGHVAVHNLVMFPCHDIHCEVMSSHWKEYSKICSQ